MVEHSGGKNKLEKDQDTKPGISDRTINVGVKRMEVGEYITITYGSSADMGKRAVATINKLGRGESFKLIYGGGTERANNGVEVQNDVGLAKFMVLSDGNRDDVFAVVDSLFKQSRRQKILNPEAMGKILKGTAGKLKIEVTNAQDGTGSVAFKGDTTPVVRAADNDVQLAFVYTPTQTIQDGVI